MVEILLPNKIQSKSIHLQTSKQNDIPNQQLFEISKMAMMEFKDLKKSYPQVIIKNEPNPIYNCHGLTFASSRTGIDNTDCLENILHDDEYYELTNISDVLPGDIILYKQKGNIIHSGIVISEKGPLGIPKVLSKWGSWSEVIHDAIDCPYHNAVIKYYRKR